MPRLWLTAAAFALAAAMFGAGLGLLPLTQPDEGRNALAATEMQASGSWLVPTLGQATYLDKPAFFFKLVGLSIGLFGATEWAARLPSALAALSLAVVAWAFGRRWLGGRVAALSVVVLATMPLYVAFSRLVIFDMVLSLFVCCAILAGHEAEATEGRARRRWYLVGAAAAGLATLVKGPVGFAVPALVHLLAARVNGNRGVLRRSLAPANIAVFLAVVLPWFVGVTLLVPDFPYYGVVHETFERLTSPSFKRNQPFWFYGMVLGLGALPWSLLLPGAALVAWRRRDALLPADRLCIVWSVAVVLFFTASRSKQPAYVLNLCVPLAILVARVLDAALSHRAGRAARAIWGALYVVLAAMALATGAALLLWRSPDLLARLPGPTEAGGTLWLGVLPAVAVATGAWGVAALLARIRASLPAAQACLALLLPALLLAAAPAFVVYAEARSSRTMARQILQHTQDLDVACLKCFPSALPFYLQQPVTLISDDATELRSNYVLFVSARDAALPPSVVQPERLPRWLAGRRRPVYLIAGKSEQQALVAIARERGVAVTQLAPDYWFALLPAAPGS